MFHIWPQYPLNLFQDTFASQQTKAIPVTIPLKPRSVVSQPRSHFGGPCKSLAVAGNPRRHIFNLSLSYCRAPTHSTWIMCTTVHLPSSRSLASVRTTRVSSATLLSIVASSQTLLVQQMLASVLAHVAKAAEFSPCTDACIRACVRAGGRACVRDPSAVSRSRLGWRLISISGVNLYKY